MKTLSKILLGLAVLGTTSIMADNGEALFKKCSGCHGTQGQKKALGKSAIIKQWDKAKIVEALKGYKEGTYGGAMKGVMKGQVIRLNDKQIESLAKYISSK